MSTIMPMRFISWTTSSPNGESPFDFGLSVAESGPVGVVGMRERHVTDAEFVIDAKHRDRVLDAMASFDADHRSDLARLVDANHVVGGGGHLERFGVLF